MFGRGRFPDFPEADDFVVPFVGERNALGTPHPAKEITDVLLPPWQGEQFVAAGGPGPGCGVRGRCQWSPVGSVVWKRPYDQGR